MIAAPFSDPELEAALAALPPDGATVFTLEGDSLRGAVVNATTAVNRARANHGLGPLETLLLGHGLVAGALLSTTLKGRDRLTIRVEGPGPAGGLSVEADASGALRGRLFRAPIAFEPGKETADPGLLYGHGYLSLTRFMEGRTEPVSGRILLETGRLAEDLARYFVLSEQTNTAFSVGLEFDRSARLVGAGGLYLQVLPGAKDDSLERLERLLAGLPQLGKFFAEGMSRADFVVRALSFFDVNVLGEAPVAFSCPCTRERLSGFVAGLPEDELRDLAANGPFPVAITCHNCGTVYRLGREDLAAMLDARGLA